ncbi:MAG TPA: hypothetical protein VEL11_12840 [Candidatus Bathyarchaeia archaeon]|nr:hypothetical protein [Candidatus Bathyarchaeia archaeon]
MFSPSQKEGERPVLERFQEPSYCDHVLSKEMTALAQILYKESFMTLKADIFEIRGSPQLRAVIHSKVSRPNREPLACEGARKVNSKSRLEVLCH